MSDSIYRLRAYDVLTLVVLALLAVGVIMVQSASLGVSGHFGFRLTDLGQKQLLFAGVGIVVYFGLSWVDYVHLLPRRRSVLSAGPLWLLLIAALCCTAVLVPGVGIERNGARRWLPLGVTNFQPSELAKWSVVIFLAWWLTHRPIDVSRFRNLLLTLIPVGGMCLLVVIQDFGTAALIAVVALAMLLAGRVKLWHLAVIVPPAMAAGYWFVAHKEYRWRRMVAFMNPYAAPQGEGYHMIQSLLSYATGGVGGTGLGGGIQKLGYLPEDTTDFIFSTLCEETGLLGALLVITLYLLVLIVAWQAIRPARDSFGRLLAFGIAAMVGTQAVINIAVATVSVPTKGLSLPLISAGGSGLVITCAAMGILASVLRHTHAEDFLPLPAKPVRPTKTVNDELWSQWTTA
ncbi:MAG TPA: putative peptidoglycan glycosyltransferase FtsW [Tepidisphaeraceae bacterium]|jgi:cell division protein FtsW